MFKIKNEELFNEIIGEAKAFPKYTTQIMNLANQNAQGTRPKNVGQMSDLIQQCPYREHYKWKKWYIQQKPHAIDDATDRILNMIEELKKAIYRIDRKMVREWVEDLVIDKTFVGFVFQRVIIKRIAEIKDMTYHFSTPKEESKGIDGFVGKIPISIKPITYKTKSMLRESIEVKIIFYEKVKGGIKVDISSIE